MFRFEKLISIKEKKLEMLNEACFGKKSENNDCNDSKLAKNKDAFHEFCNALVEI